MKYKVLAYYYLVDIEDPLKEVEKHKKFFANRDFRGRIYISHQGINGQASGREGQAEEYIDWLKSDGRFQKMPFKIHVSSGHAFEKMRVKYRKQLVAFDRRVDFSQIGERVSAQKWRRMLEEKGKDTLLVDVRNRYESKIGHFEGALLPDLENFREFPEYVRKLKGRLDPKATRVMMYCTGGIRCEFFSALMKEEGFENVYQLDGGVIDYGIKEGQKHWKGKLFVFDDRLGIPIGGEKAEPIAFCKHCDTPNDTYVNCANMDCNELFLCCKNCLQKLRGCCSSKCLHSPRVRPYRDDGKPFRKMPYKEKCKMKDDALLPD